MQDDVIPRVLADVQDPCIKNKVLTLDAQQAAADLGGFIQVQGFDFIGITCNGVININNLVVGQKLHGVIAVHVNEFRDLLSAFLVQAIAFVRQVYRLGNALEHALPGSLVGDVLLDDDLDLA